MRTIFILKAAATKSGDYVEPLTVIAAQPTPTDLDTADLLAYFDGQAEALVDAMLTHLPGGFIDKLLDHLLKKRGLWWSWL